MKDFIETKASKVKKVRVDYEQGAPPELIMYDSKGEVAKTVNVGEWKSDTIVEFLADKLDDAPAAKVKVKKAKGNAKGKGKGKAGEETVVEVKSAEGAAAAASSAPKAAGEVTMLEAPTAPLDTSPAPFIFAAASSRPVFCFFLDGSASACWELTINCEYCSALASNVSSWAFFASGLSFASRLMDLSVAAAACNSTGALVGVVSVAWD